MNNKSLTRKQAIFPTLFIATGWFVLSPLWVGFCLIIPAAIYIILNPHKVVFHGQSKYASSSTIYRRSSHASSISSQSHLLGCHSLSQRKDRYGF